MKSSFVWFSVLLVFGTALAVWSFQTTTSPDPIVATYSHGVLHVAVPYSLNRIGPGNLTVEVLDPEDRAIAKLTSRIAPQSTKGEWREEIRLEKPIVAEDLVWHRLRYRFVYDDASTAGAEGIESISRILRTPVVHVLGQRSYIAGASAAVRVVAMDSQNRIIAGENMLRIELTGSNSPAHTLYSGRLNERGTAQPQLNFPAGLTGNYELRYSVDTPIGSTEFTQQIRLEDKTAILLTTEKPIYQPGQTIHVRALALDRADHRAAAARVLNFEIQDSRGNKVFKKATKTDAFGIAAAGFALADEVNLGAYHLRAVMDGNNSSEVALNVERYVLPKFKVAVEFADKKKHGYRPGDHVTGTVRANYFFGKPVVGEVAIKGTGMDVAAFDAGSAQGKTDADGSYHFDLKLPDYFVGKPLAGGAARVLIEATVKDSADHSETRGEPITVSTSPLIVNAIPEGGTLIPSLDNQVFIVTSYADGKPAVTEVKVPGQTVHTDENGIAVVHVQSAETKALQVDAADKDGNRASASIALQSRGGSDQILLRAEKAVYRPGDRIALRIFSTKQRGSVYLDAIKEGQTILTRDLDLHNGVAELTLAATPAMTGTVDFNAYQFGTDAIAAADHRLVFVEPADELKIEAITDRPVYKPGEEAQVRFRVSNSKGEGVAAALGLQVVDEAVFALAEKQPGFAKVFFYLEQEALKPRYEIHSLSMSEIVEPHFEQRDRAASALFAATELAGNNKLEIDAGKNVGAAKFASYAARYRAEFTERTPAELSRAYAHSDGNLSKGPGVDDFWGTRLRIQPVTWNAHQFVVQSAGPDKQFNTGDDLWMNAVVVRGGAYVNPEKPSIIVGIEHERGPINGLARISGSVSDVTGAVISKADVIVVDSATRKSRTTKTDEGGSFDFAAVPPGDYEIRIASPGFRAASRRISVAPRDSAMLSATLGVDSATNMVEVAAVPPPPARAMFAGMGGGKMRVGGNLQGVIGGVPGGVPGAMVQFDRAELMAGSIVAKDAQPAAHVRSFFPEALYINPEIITDSRGNASISIPLPDSITTWRMAMVASTTRGALGSGTSSVKVFQDFFADLDLPVTLTQGDRISIPVAIYNYSGSPGDVRLKLKSDDWFQLVEDTPQKTIGVDADHPGGSQFTIEAKRIGKFKLTLSANMNNRADIVVREIEVVPNGREQSIVFNGRLDSAVAREIDFPANSIPEASSVLVRLYPGPLSQVIEGMDAILRMPGGCFEQTSSSTYPNVLALDYMKRTNKSTPEIHAKAEGYIANGYQRLLTFEVPGGGFSWFGQAPANKILTAYGLMEFSDMSKVYDVDANVIRRTQQWLASQQQPDGSWKPDTSFINEGATNRYNNDVLRITAYIAWALENTGYRGAAVDKARQYVAQHARSASDAYTLAVIANFAAEDPGHRELLDQAIQQLLDAHTEKDDQAWWSAEETGVYSRGSSAAIETTGLAVQALLKSGQASAVAEKALRYIASKKDATGAWGSTQATIMALRAVLLSTEKGSADVRGTLEISLNGTPVQTLSLTADNNDLLHQFVLKNIGAQNKIDIRFRGTGGLAYQVAGRYFVPWTEKPANEPLSINVSYDRTRLSQDDIATATAVIKNNLNKTANMVMVDLGIPPGFDLLTEDLQDYKEKSAARQSGRLEKFNLTATQAILYFDSLAPSETVSLKFWLRAKYPIRARTFQSRVYEYYDPDVSSVAAPVALEVRKR